MGFEWGLGLVASPALLGSRGVLRAPPASGLTLAAITTGLTKQWSDTCSNADPLTAAIWNACDAERVDGLNQATEHHAGGVIADILSTRFVHSATGGPVGNPGYYKMWNKQSSSAVYATPPTGRASLGYPIHDPGSAPTHSGPGGVDIFYMYEGRRQICAFSTYLDENINHTTGTHTAWNLDPPVDWRVLVQWKQNEFVSVTTPTYDSPILALEQKGGEYRIVQLGASTLWSVTATGTVGSWVNWAFDTTYSGDTAVGKFRVYADFNNDGIYEYDGGLVTGVQTLVPFSGRTGADPSGLSLDVESMFNLGPYAAIGDDQLRVADFSIWGTPGG